MFELGNEQEAVEKATEIMQVHLGDDSDERIKLKQSIGPITELDSEVFNELMKQWIKTLEEKYEDYKVSAKYFWLYNTLNLEVKQYIVLRKAGLIPTE